MPCLSSWYHKNRPEINHDIRAIVAGGNSDESGWRSLVNMANILLNLILIVSLSITAANAKDYFVAQNGIDDKAGSEKKPWRTIQHTASTAQAADTVYECKLWCL